MAARKRYNSPLMAERRQHILALARQMLAEAGYDGLSMRELAARANVAVSTIYTAFGSKDDLIYEASSDLYQQSFSPASASPHRPSLEIIALVCDGLGRNTRPSVAYAQACCRIYFLADRGSAIGKKLSSLLHDWILDLLGTMQTRDEVQSWTPLASLAQDISSHLWAMVYDWTLGLHPDASLGTRYELILTTALLPYATTAFRPALDARVGALARLLAG